MADHFVVRIENHTPLVWRLLYVWDWIWVHVFRQRLRIRARHLPRPADFTIDGEPGSVASVQYVDREVVLDLTRPPVGDTVIFTRKRKQGK